MDFDLLKTLKLDSQLIPDKVVFRSSTTQSVPLAASFGDYHEYTIPHGLSFVPAVIGSYSDDGFATSYDFGVGPYGYLPTYAIDGATMQAHAWADATNITIRAIAHNTARTMTFHVVGLWPGGGLFSGAHSVTTPPVQDQMLLTTDSNTLKHRYLTTKIMTTNGLGTYVGYGYATGVSTPLRPFCFIYEDGRLSYMNTYNTITSSGVVLSATSGPDNLTISVLSYSVKTVTILVKAYLDA